MSKPSNEIDVQDQMMLKRIKERQAQLKSSMAKKDVEPVVDDDDDEVECLDDKEPEPVASAPPQKAVNLKIRGQCGEKGYRYAMVRVLNLFANPYYQLIRPVTMKGTPS